MNQSPIIQKYLKKFPIYFGEGKTGQNHPLRGLCQPFGHAIQPDGMGCQPLGKGRRAVGKLRQPVGG